MPPEFPGTVAVAYVHPNMVHEGFARSLAHACRWPGSNILGIHSASNPRQTVARNAAIADFLIGPAEWLMWIDTDMEFGYDAIEKLRITAEKEDADMVTGLGFIYKRDQGEIVPNGYLWNGEEDAFGEILDYTSGETYVVDGTGSGFVLVNRRVFEAWDEPYWHRNWIHHPVTGREMGHDLAFFYEATQVRGFRLLWDTAVTTGHIKHMPLTEDNYRQYQESIK